MQTETAHYIDHLNDRKTVKFIPDRIGEGGCKVVYFTEDKQSVVCFFKDQKAQLDPRRQDRLIRILTNLNPTITRDQGGCAEELKDANYFKEYFCWPTGIVLQPMFGIITPTYPKNFFFNEGRFKGKEKNGRWFASNKLRSMLPNHEKGNWLNYLQMCGRMARAVRKLHMAGLAHSDLSDNNVLMDATSGKCVVIDIDSLVVKGLYPPDVLGTPGFIAPEVLKTLNLAPDDPARCMPCKETDEYALAVLIYRYLLRRHPLEGPKIHSPDTAIDEHLGKGQNALFIEHPKDSSNRPRSLTVPFEALGPYLSKYILTAFTDGLHNPHQRPPAGDAETALSRTTDSLLQCGNTSCEEKWFVYQEGKEVKCPWCGWKMKNRIPYFQFSYAPRAGQFRPESYGTSIYGLTCWQNRTIHEWHVNQGKRFNERADSKVLAYVGFINGEWVLVNKELDSLEKLPGTPIPVGQSTILKEGDELVLSKAEKGRMVKVKMIP